jgi:hypothetical protein
MRYSHLPCQFGLRNARIGRNEKPCLRVWYLYRHFKRCRHSLAVRPHLGRPTLRHVWCVLPHRYRPSRLWSRPDLGGIGIPRALGGPRLGPRHLDRGDNDGSDGSAGHRARSRHHRLVVAAGIGSCPSHGDSSHSLRRLHRIRLRSR